MKDPRQKFGVIDVFGFSCRWQEAGCRDHLRSGVIDGSDGRVKIKFERSHRIKTIERILGSHKFYKSSFNAHS